MSLRTLPTPRRRSAWLRGCLSLVVFSLLLILVAGMLINSIPAARAMPAQQSSGIISNGVIQLGVNPEGNLIVEGGTMSSGAYGTTQVGLRYVPTNGDAISPGCDCEGWGVADVTTGATGHANLDYGAAQNMSVVQFTTTASTATSVVNVAGKMKVTHAYHPSPKTPNLYQVG